MARSRVISDVWLISSLLVACIIGRLLILSLIDAMAFPAINSTYLAPAFPLLMLAVALMLISPIIGPTAGQSTPDPETLQQK